MSEVREHVADGIQEYDNPLPRWWLYGFYLTIAIAAVYCVLYPCTWFWNGTQNWSSAGQLAADIAAYPPKVKELASAEEANEIVKMSKDPAIVAAGKTIFATNCAVCHGDDARGKIGPNLRDHDGDAGWRYGGSAKDILTTIRGGRPKGMPVWGKVMSPEKTEHVAAYIYSLRYKSHAGGPEAAR